MACLTITCSVQDDCYLAVSSLSDHLVIQSPAYHSNAGSVPLTPQPATTPTGARQAPTVIKMSNSGATLMLVPSESAPSNVSQTAAAVQHVQPTSLLTTAATNVGSQHTRPHDKFLVVQTTADTSEYPPQQRYFLI